MLGRMNWFQFAVAFVIAGVIGQRFAHKHPIPSVAAANTPNGQG